MKLFPGLKPELKNILGRMVDLCALIRKNYYHAGFCGSFSLKRVLPVMVPGMGYDKLEIQEGGSASAYFYFMARGRYSAAEVKRIKRDLLKYCGQDTLAMYEMHKGLGGLGD